MGENSAIEWTDATVNFWWGCTKVGPGCDHCYAEAWSKRTGGGIWGVGAPRRKIKSAVSLLYKLHNGASWWAADYHISKIVSTPQRRVFIQSMSDLFDGEVPIEWFAEAWRHVSACDRLAIQIVTKRISVVEKRLAAIGALGWPQHAGLMISIVNQDEADRDVPRLLALKGKLGIPWVGLSIEPLLGPVDFDPCDLALVDWIIVGGESGPGARPLHPDWARSLRDQCASAGVPFLWKQWGEWAPNVVYTMLDGDRAGELVGLTIISSTDRKQVGERVFYAMPANAESKPGPVERMERVGKKRAGRLLDGVTHDGMPASFSPAQAPAWPAASQSAKAGPAPPPPVPSCPAGRASSSASAIGSTSPPSG